MTAPNMAWTPDGVRTVTPVVQRALRGVRVAQIPLAWPPKASAELLPFQLDLTEMMEAACDSIASVVAVMSPSGGTYDAGVTWSEFDGSSVTFGLSGGVPGTTYRLAIEITTRLGFILWFNVALPVSRASPPAVAVAAQQPITISGFAMTLLGAPITL